MTKNKSFLTNLKTVSILLAICLICGALLALCNDLLYVTPAELQERVFKKAYPTFKKDTSFNHRIDKNFAKLPNGYGEVLSVTKSTDGAYAIEAKGFDGYSGGWGSIYLFLKENAEGKVVIVAWAKVENSGQSFWGNITEQQEKSWYVGKEISADWNTASDYHSSQFYKDGYYVSGASESSRAIANAVSVASYYAMNALGLGENKEGDAIKAIDDLLGASYGFVKVADESYVAEMGVDFYFEAVRENVKYGAYTYATDDESIFVAVIKAGLSNTDLESEQATATVGFDADKLAKIQATGYLNYLYPDSVSLSIAYVTNEKFGNVSAVIENANGSYDIVATGIGGYPNGNGSITIKVNIKDSTITAWEYISNVNQSYWDDGKNVSATEGLYTWYVGAKTDALPQYGKHSELKPDGYFTSGATMTSFAISNAVNMAADYYENVLKGGAE